MLAQFFQRIDAVFLRHHDVEQQQIDGAVQQRQRLLAIVRDDDIKTFHFKQFFNSEVNSRSSSTNRILFIMIYLQTQNTSSTVAIP